jgi:hypothetical protein
MARRCLALVPLLVSVALHAAVLLVLAGSANGAESDFAVVQAPRLVGNTFEIETLQEAAPQLPESAVQHAQAVAAPPERVVAPPALPSMVPEEQVPARPSDTPAQPSATEAPEAVESAPEPEPQAAPSPALAAALAGDAARAAAPEVKTAPAASQPETVDSAAGQAASATSDLPAAPVYGQASLPTNVGSLAKAFTRAVPRAAFRDPAWHRLPMGAAGKVVFSIELDNMGKLVGAVSVERTEPEPPVFLKNLVARTVLMLKAGTFALTPQGLQAGTQRFELSAELRRVAALDDVLAEPEDLRQIGRLVEPTRVRPGKANFTYNSGRQVELTIRMLAE